VNGNVQVLAPLVKLKYLDLGYTKVAGDVKSLALLIKLRVLSLGGTKVGGQAHTLASLVDLSYLYLGNTSVAGCSAFCATGGSFYKHCDPKHGDPNCSCWC
jgi:hypothetical protein